MIEVDRETTGLVITDPQNDFLSPEGATWGLVGSSVTDNKTVENIEALFKAAKTNGLSVFISPDLGDGYAAAVTNFGFIANAVLTTEDAVAA